MTVDTLQLGALEQDTYIFFLVAFLLMTLGNNSSFMLILFKFDSLPALGF